MANRWLEHLKKFWQSQGKGKMSYRQAMKEAKKSYSKKAVAPGDKKKARKRRVKKK